MFHLFRRLPGKKRYFHDGRPLEENPVKNMTFSKLSLLLFY